ncbi:MAG TPA: YbhB/YbcL family Raf kinase inhibitor-like protein [Gemmatimonadaceae bacterium]
MTASVASALLTMTMSAALIAQGPPNATEPGAAQLALLNYPAKGGAKLTVTTPAFQPGGDIPFVNTQYQGNVFPGLAWGGAPSSTKSFAVILQDGDAMVRGAPILHWTMVNIPSAVTKLAPGMKDPPQNAQFGPNIRGTAQPYMGPRTPAGPKHRYHFQVFALNRMIPTESSLTYDQLTAAMKDHVVASGEVIGLGQVAPAK